MKNTKRQARIKILGCALLAVLVPAVLFAADEKAALNLPAGAEQAAKAIDRAALETPIRYLSDDKLEGRGPSSRGDEMARQYLADSLKTLGYQPGAADGSWQQAVSIVGITSAVPKTWD